MLRTSSVDSGAAVPMPTRWFSSAVRMLPLLLVTFITVELSDEETCNWAVVEAALPIIHF